MTNLVLRRRIGESIDIGADVVVTILDVVGRQVKVSVTAPPNVALKRSELPGVPVARNVMVHNPKADGNR